MPILPAYASTRNKDRVRREDTRLVRQDFIRKGRRLAYLGMPSGEMKDLLEWHEFLGRISAVEIDPKMRAELALNILRNDLQGITTILFGDIEEILVKGRDKYRNKLLFKYDIVFLDFFGTILYKDLKRVKAVKSLLEYQEGHDFLLLLTFNLRKKKYTKHAVKQVVDKIKKDIIGFYACDEFVKSKVIKVLDFYKSDDIEEFYRQKLFVPYFVKTTGEKAGFKVHAFAPIYYKGYKNSPMIHFAFRLTAQEASPTQAISEQSLIDIINLNVKQTEKGRVFVMRKQMERLMF